MLDKRPLHSALPSCPHIIRDQEEPNPSLHLSKARVHPSYIATILPLYYQKYINTYYSPQADSGSSQAQLRLCSGMLTLCSG